MKRNLLALLCLLLSIHILDAQTVAITNYAVSPTGQVQLSIQGDASKYYLLRAQHSPTFNWVVSMTLGVNGTMIITEPGAAYPQDRYTITAYDIANPGDWDGDGINDLVEYNNMPTDAPINHAFAVDFEDGSTSIPDAETFMALAAVNDVPWAPFLDGQLYVKFGILNRDTPQPEVYFINSNTHTIHAGFFNAIGANVTGDDGSGEIVFNPTDISPNGVIGTYSFNFSFGDALSFAATQRTFELLAANMPFLQNNLNHFIGQNDESNYLNNFADDFVGSRIEVVLESEVFGDFNFIPFHEAEGYGFFRQMDLSETPGSRDIVLYDQLPNSLPRVGGIITSVIQTPLSHVNLRAIQEDIPNAYIANPLSIDSIANLLGTYVHYIVENDRYILLPATLEEVNAWYENLRPTEPQIPIRDLSVTQIKPLDEIEFEMSTAFGAKCANVATMRTFGFPNGTIPNGFGIPFYYYDEFMKFNNFYEEIEVMINNPAFINDINFREDRLSTFREDIRNAPMPAWMMDSLQAMHNAFPPGTKVRCRSSTNNEDLPGFSGAGLYTSKTHRLDEGHISKTIKQVFASMWNFRAFEERDFYRVDHYVAAMAVLCHPNYEEEESNGVGISIDPIYNTEGTFYLNTQVGESLITNPDPNSVPEELLLYENPTQGSGYLVLNLSNLTAPGQLVMDQVYLDQLRNYLTVIHNEFAILYDVVGQEGFAMDIEYKVDSSGQLIIKQARPWVSFWGDIRGDYDLGVEAVINPQSSSSLGNNELVSVTISNNGLNPMSNFDISLYVNNQFIQTLTINETIEAFNSANYQFTTPANFSSIGNYTVKCIVSDDEDQFSKNDTLIATISKLHVLDGGITMGSLNVACNDEVEANFKITNHGETTITNVQYVVIVNGLTYGTFSEVVNIPSQAQATLTVNIDNNLSTQGNLITINILSVNNQVDGGGGNNSATGTTNLESNYDMITLVINPDDFPYETSWEIYDNTQQRVVDSGDLDFAANVFTKDICVDYNSCFSITLFDSYGDGICCNFGNGNFQVLNSTGTVLVSNNGQFQDEVTESFCPGGGCGMEADIRIEHTYNNNGFIKIFMTSGVGPYQYSINNGLTFQTSNTFTGLAPGSYNIVVQGGLANCSFDSTITLELCSFTVADIDVTPATSTATADGSIVITPGTGVAPILYSNDGGNTFVTNNVFSNLPVGNYNVIVKDGSGLCNFRATVPIGISTSLEQLQNDQAQHLLRMYPNPTVDQVTIELTPGASISENVNIVVVDLLGRPVHSGTLSNKDGGKTLISLQGFAPGNYFVKCYNSTFEKTFKLIKL